MRALLAVLLASFILVADAGAAVVARDGDRVLHASKRGGDLCLRLSGAGSSCSNAPPSAFRPLMFESEDAIAAAVPARVRFATIGDRRVETVAAPGFGSRFLLVTGVDPTGLLRFYDAEDALIGAARSDDAYGERPDDAVLLDAGGVRITARRDFELRPDPLRIDRTVPATCYSADFAGAGGFSTCRADRGAPPLDVQVEDRCGRRPVLAGAVRPDVVELEAVLGSGRRVKIPARALNEPFTTFRLVAAALPRREAVRSIRGLDATGATRGRLDLREAPGGLPCRESLGRSGFDVISYGGGHGFTAQAPTYEAATAAGERLLVADGRGGAVICVSFVRPGRGCQQAPVESTYVPLERRGNAIGGVLSREVATATIRLDRGRPLTVDTTDGPAYAGRFAGHVRFLAAAIPAGRVVRGVILRDAGGRRTGRAFVLGRFSRRVVARVRPGLLVERFTGGLEGSTGVSFQVRPRHRRGFFGVSPSRDRLELAVSVGCAPRRALVFAYLPPGVRGAVLELSTGVRLPGRVTRVPGGRLWVGVPPAGAKVRAVVFSEPVPAGLLSGQEPSARVPLRLLPAARQCGYDVYAP